MQTFKPKEVKSKSAYKNAMLSQERKIAEDKRKLIVKCEHCNKSVVLYPKTERIICNVCQNYIYKNQEIKEKYEAKKKKFDFEKELKKLLRENPSKDYQSNSRRKNKKDKKFNKED